MTKKGNARSSSVVLAVLNDMLDVEQFESYTDLVESFKGRLSRLRIPYDGVIVGAAIRAVEHTGRRLVAPEQSGRAPLPLASRSSLGQVPLDRAESAALLRRLRVGPVDGIDFSKVTW